MNAMPGPPKPLACSLLLVGVIFLLKTLMHSLFWQPIDLKNELFYNRGGGSIHKEPG